MLTNSSWNGAFKLLQNRHKQTAIFRAEKFCFSKNIYYFEIFFEKSPIWTGLVNFKKVSEVSIAVAQHGGLLKLKSNFQGHSTDLKHSLQNHFDQKILFWDENSLFIKSKKIVYFFPYTLKSLLMAITNFNKRKIIYLSLIRKSKTFRSFQTSLF